MCASCVAFVTIITVKVHTVQKLHWDGEWYKIFQFVISVVLTQLSFLNLTAILLFMLIQKKTFCNRNFRDGMTHYKLKIHERECLRRGLHVIGWATVAQILEEKVCGKFTLEIQSLHLWRIPPWPPTTYLKILFSFIQKKWKVYLFLCAREA